MPQIDFLALAPIGIVSCFAIIMMVLLAFHRSHALTAFLYLAALALSLAFIARLHGRAAVHISSLLVMDGHSFFYMGLICAAAVVVGAISFGYLAGRTYEVEEYYLLLLLGVAGAMVIAGSRHFFSFFLGLEILSVSLYGLIAYERLRDKSIEAGFKYLVLAAVSAAFLLFGMALIYARFGTMEFGEVGRKIASSPSGNPLVIAGGLLILVGIAFKLALVPFHMWTPDVYEGAPAPVSAFIATVSKGALFAVLIRYFGPQVSDPKSALFLIFSVLSATSMVAGNLLALLQDNVKRILAYSSIAHMGYLLVALLAGQGQGVAIGFYLVSYFITTLGAFGVITVLSVKESDADSIYHLYGLAGRRPWLAVVFTAMLLSLAGIPLTAGFMGKFFVARAGASSSLWLLLVFLALNSGIGIFYYLRLISAMFRQGGAEKPTPIGPAASVVDRAVLACLLLLLFALGLYPDPLIGIIEKAIGGLV